MAKAPSEQLQSITERPYYADLQFFSGPFLADLEPKEKELYKAIFQEHLKAHDLTGLQNGLHEAAKNNWDKIFRLFMKKQEFQIRAKAYYLNFALTAIENGHLALAFRLACEYSFPHRTPSEEEHFSVVRALLVGADKYGKQQEVSLEAYRSWLEDLINDYVFTSHLSLSQKEKKAFYEYFMAQDFILVSKDVLEPNNLKSCLFRYVILNKMFKDAVIDLNEYIFKLLDLLFRACGPEEDILLLDEVLVASLGKLTLGVTASEPLQRLRAYATVYGIIAEEPSDHGTIQAVRVRLLNKLLQLKIDNLQDSPLQAELSNQVLKICLDSSFNTPQSEEEILRLLELQKKLLAPLDIPLENIPTDLYVKIFDNPQSDFAQAFKKLVWDPKPKLIGVFNQALKDSKEAVIWFLLQEEEIQTYIRTQDVLTQFTKPVKSLAILEAQPPGSRVSIIIRLLLTKDAFFDPQSGRGKELLKYMEKKCASLKSQKGDFYQFELIPERLVIGFYLLNEYIRKKKSGVPVLQVAKSSAMTVNFRQLRVPVTPQKSPQIKLEAALVLLEVYQQALLKGSKVDVSALKKLESYRPFFGGSLRAIDQMLQCLFEEKPFCAYILEEELKSPSVFSSYDPSKPPVHSASAITSAPYFFRAAIGTSAKVSAAPTSTVTSTTTTTSSSEMSFS